MAHFSRQWIQWEGRVLYISTAQSSWGMFLVTAGVATGLAALSLATSAVILAGLAATVITFIRPAIGLLLLTLIIPFGSIWEIPLGPAAIGVAEAFTVLVLSAWLAQMLSRGSLHIATTRVWLPMGAFLATMLASLTQALSLGWAIKELAKWLEFAAVLVCAASLAGRSERRLFLGASLSAGLAAALLGWYQFLQGVGPEGFLLFGRFMRAYGAFRQPNPYAGYLGLIVPLAFSVLLTYWPWGRRSASRIERMIWILALVSLPIMLGAIVMSWSRGAWFGIAAGLLTVILARGWRVTALFGLLAIMMISIGLLAGLDRLTPAALLTRLTDFADYFIVQDVTSIEPTPANWAVIERLAHWQAAGQMFAEHPWLGVGIGNFTPTYPVYRLPRWADPLGHAHNFYLNIAAETGIFGLATYLSFWAAIFLTTAHLFRTLRFNEGLERGLALGALGMLVHLSIHNVFDNLYVQGIYLQIAMTIGMALSLSSPAAMERHAG